MVQTASGGIAATDGDTDPNSIRVFLVDDSGVVRRIVSDVLRHEAGIALAGTAANGREALERLGSARPHVVILDVEMPELDGRETMVEIRKRWPKLPVVMFSSISERGAAATFDAMARGAKDFITKPSMAGSPEGAIASVRANLVPVVRAWGDIARRRASAERMRSEVRPQTSAPSKVAPVSVAARRPSPPVVLRRPPMGTGRISAVVMASSTGGPNALIDVVPSLPGDIPVPILLVQHMPPTFTKHLAQRLNASSALTVVEAEPGLIAQPGHLYVAQGGFHMVVHRAKNEVRVELDDGSPENSCKPAADVLFRSAVEVWGGQLLAVVMTGMGQDGMLGAKCITDAGGSVIAQDEESSVVWGMPGAVAKAGLASEVVPLKDLSGAIGRRLGLKGVMAR